MENSTSSKGLLDKILECQNNSELADLGRKLVQEARSKKEAPIFLKKDEDFVGSIKDKLESFYELEKSGDYLWMEYDVWNTFPTHTQAMFKDLLEPLILNGVHVQKSTFEKYENLIMGNMHVGTMYIICKESKIYRMLCFSFHHKSSVDWLGDWKFRDFKKKFDNKEIIPKKTYWVIQHEFKEFFKCDLKDDIVENFLIKQKTKHEI